MATENKEVRQGDYWWEAENKRSKRLDYFRKALWSKDSTSGDFQSGVMAGVDKMYWFTRVFNETEGEPWVIRRAKALVTTLENQPVFIADQSRIVGYSCARPNEVIVQCEVNEFPLWDFYYDRREYIAARDREWYPDAVNYWSKNCFREQMDRYLTEEEKANMGTAVVWPNAVYGQGFSSACAQYDFVYEHGFDGISQMIDQYRGEVWQKIHSGPSTPEVMDLLPKIDQWNAMQMSIEGFKTWVNRYSRLARIIAENFEEDPKRKAELLKISDICAAVAGGRPEHFQEVIQAHHFIMLVTRMIERHHAGHGFRLDQVWWPQYKRDVLEEKILTREEVVDLLGEFQMRHHETSYMTFRALREASTGSLATFPVMTIGGVTEEGRDACNDLTDALLEAVRLVRCAMPSYMFRYHPNARVSTLKSVFECIKHGLGYPSIQNDAVLLDTLISHYGATLEEARGYANVVCMSPGITNGRGGQGVRYSPDIMASKVLDLTLHDGYDVVKRMQWGPKTGDPSQFKTFEEFWEAWRSQLRYHADAMCRVRNILRWGELNYFQEPFLACCFERCVRKGVDVAYPADVSNAWVTAYIWMDTPDSLYAVKKLVFEGKKYTMEQLIDAINADWEGYEEMRLDFVNAPKWGNDIDEVDDIVAAATKTLADEFARNIEIDGRPFMILPENVGAYLMGGSMVAALPNGRRYGDPLYDGGSSPGPGMDKKGPTAVLRSCSKIDYGKLKNCLLNQRVSHSQMAGEKGFQLWANYMKTWYDLGVPHVQFNCVDSETLRAAQMEPEKYSEVIVRVAGYSAHFVDLPRMCQDAIVSRTLQEV